MKQLILIFAKSSQPVNQLEQLHFAANPSNADKYVFYDGFIPLKEIWENKNYQKFIQLGFDKTEKIMNAFIKGFLKKYESIVLIEANAPVTNQHIEEAFFQLKIHELVVGPVNNGSLYLIGMKRFRPEIFETEINYKTILQLAQSRKISVATLPESETWVGTKVTV